MFKYDIYCDHLCLYAIVVVVIGHVVWLTVFQTLSSSPTLVHTNISRYINTVFIVRYQCLPIHAPILAR